MTYLPEVREALKSAIDQSSPKPVARWYQNLQRAAGFAIPAMAVLITAGIVAFVVWAGLHSRAANTPSPRAASSQPVQTGRSFARYGPVSAKVMSTSAPRAWYQTLRIDKGSTDGIRRGDPVIANGALVGDISSVGATYAVVAGLDSAKFKVEVRILDSGAKGRRLVGMLRPVPDTPKALEVAFLPNGELISGDEVVTAGLTDPHLTSEYPPGIPVGTISDFSQEQLTSSGAVGVSPIVKLQAVSRVEVLTKHP